MLKFVLVASVLCLYYIASVEAISGDAIAEKANSYVGNTTWSYASSHHTGRYTYKCNIFIYDIMKELGGDVPHRRWWISPIGAREWAKSDSSYLQHDFCWVNVQYPDRGDVMAADGHVAFYAGDYETTSANKYRIVTNDWGFQSGTDPGSASRPYAYWRYIC